MILRLFLTGYQRTPDQQVSDRDNLRRLALAAIDGDQFLLDNAVTKSICMSEIHRIRSAVSFPPTAA